MQITINHTAYSGLIDALNIAIERLSYYADEKATIFFIEDALARAEDRT